LRAPKRYTSQRKGAPRSRQRIGTRARLRERDQSELRCLVERQQAAIDALEALGERPGGAAADKTVVRVDAGVGPDSVRSEGTLPELPASPTWPAYRFPKEPLFPLLSPAAAALHGKRLRVVAISVFGREGRSLERIIEMVCRRQREEKNFVPVFLTDSPHADAFTRRRLAFEYLPRSVYQQRARMRSRFRLIERKWDVASFIDLSAVTSPFREEGSDDSHLDAPPDQAAASADADALAEDVALVRASGLFDEDWYLRRYPDVALAHVDPIVHYLTLGAAQGRDPSPLFQTEYYALQMLRTRAKTS
jgi:hypothetical protein